MKTVLFQDVGIGQSFINRTIDGVEVFRKIGEYSATSDGMFEDFFVLREPVEIED